MLDVLIAPMLEFCDLVEVGLQRQIHIRLVSALLEEAWMKARSQSTKQAAIRMLLWQDIVVLLGTAVWLLR